MRIVGLIAALSSLGIATQAPLPLQHASQGPNVSVALFAELEELARVVDIAYCVTVGGFGVTKPFSCLSRCTDFPSFVLVDSWNTGPLFSDSCGYIALDHGKGRIVVAFRGTYDIINTITDLTTIPQEYVPYPGDGEAQHQGIGAIPEAGRVSQQVVNGNASPLPPSHLDQAKCTDCTVHMGFQTSWTNTRARIMPYLEQQVFLYPHYKLHLVGHSLGGAVAALAGLDMLAHGWYPIVTTFGEPRIGNKGLVKHIDERFNLLDESEDDTTLRFRHVTHAKDPVPLLPPTEWGFAMHAGEIHITRDGTSLNASDLQHCVGDNDPTCAAGQDPTVLSDADALGKRDLLDSIKNEVQDVLHEPWGIPARYKIWDLVSAHRDYFWRLGLCVPGGDPSDRKGRNNWRDWL
ncbi:hypothetical protein LTR08_007894 [Meristemomyces frigidus]|nr:hypothetical protein LTR08_007894 [Meristemomyces frigidus]